MTSPDPNPTSVHCYPLLPTAGQFRFWLDMSQAGESLVYHVGTLLLDRDLGKEIRAVADLAWDAAQGERPRVELKQRRLDTGRYEYIAQKIVPRGS